MGKVKYEMNVDKPTQMDTQQMLQLKNIYLAPYMQLATELIGKARHAGGNMFRHQIDTMAILIDYGYIDSVLLKAACVHDVDVNCVFSFIIVGVVCNVNSIL